MASADNHALHKERHQVRVCRCQSLLVKVTWSHVVVQRVLLLRPTREARLGRGPRFTYFAHRIEKVLLIRICLGSRLTIVIYVQQARQVLVHSAALTSV